MPTPAQIAARLASDINGIDPILTYGEATSKLKIKSLLDLVSLQSTQVQRGHLDQMSPACRLQLIASLTALHTIVAN